MNKPPKGQTTGIQPVPELVKGISSDSDFFDCVDDLEEADT